MYHMGVTMFETDGVDGVLPTLSHCSFLSFVNATKGFGVFAAEDIPCGNEELNTTEACTASCIATYGGQVCCEHEASAPNYIYRMATGTLPRCKGRFSNTS